MRVLGIDPGDHTGLSLVEFGDKPTILATQMVMYDNPKFTEILSAIFDSPNLDHVAMEDFAIVPGRAHVFQGNRMIVTRIIGRVEEIAQQHGHEVQFVRPVERNWFDKDKLRMLGLQTKFGTDHERDATYIALYASYFKWGRDFGRDATTIRHEAARASNLDLGRQA